MEREAYAGVKEGGRQVDRGGGRKPGAKWRQLRCEQKVSDPLTGGSCGGAWACGVKKRACKCSRGWERWLSV